MFGSHSNGQANAHLGAALLLGAVCLAQGRWWTAVLFVCLSVAIKPLGLAAVGLAFAVYPRLGWRLGVGLAGTLLLPFLCAPPDYVASQFADALANLRQCAVVTDNRFADLNGLLRAVRAPSVERPPWRFAGRRAWRWRRFASWSSAVCRNASAPWAGWPAPPVT